MQTKTRRAEGARRWLSIWALAVAAGTAHAATGESRLVTIQKATGKPLASITLWRTAGKAGVSPVTGGGWAYFVENGETLCGLNLTSGRVFWRTRLTAPATFATLAGRNLLLVYDATRLSAYAPLTGKRLWETDLQMLGEEWRLHETVQFAAERRHLVLCTAAQILCLDATTGEPLWGKQNAGLAERPSIVFTDDAVFARSTGDGVRWTGFNLVDGFPAKEMEPPQSAVGRRPVAVPSGLTVAKDGRSLTAAVGSRRWSYRAPEPFAIGRVIGETGNVLLLQLVTAAPQSVER
jgi:outer membrane protein assembly factor BamB